LDSNWNARSAWSCLTGTAQLAHCMLMLHQESNEAKYRQAGMLANQYVRRTIKVDGPPEMRGGVKGSFPLDGGYGTYQYLNWACKFMVDANMLEQQLQIKWAL